jgi:leader peptidase (prepilin peptidase)/N-methyltransferase
MPEQVFFIIGAAVVGLCVGSFLNVVIHRLPRMLDRGWQMQCAELRGEEIAEQPAYNLVVPRSQCPSCGHQITASENVPVLSWLALGGKCSACKAPIAIRYPVVEMLGALLAVYAVVRFGPTVKGFAACGLL